MLEDRSFATSHATPLPDLSGSSFWLLRRHHRALARPAMLVAEICQRTCIFGMIREWTPHQNRCRWLTKVSRIQLVVGTNTGHMC
jgi:hypothetical protein